MNGRKVSESEISVTRCTYPNGNTFFDVKFSSNGIVIEQHSFKLKEDGTTLTIANGSNEIPDISNRAVKAIRYSIDNDLFN